MPERPLSDIFKLRDLRNPYLLAGLAGRIAATHEQDSFTNKRLDAAIGKLVLGEVIATDNDEVAKQYEDTQLWHGTGRYQYRDGVAIDTLESIASTGQLLPKYDAFDLNRPMYSLSLAKSRVYARAYADMHGRGARETERYGTSLFWACAFFGSIAVEASKEVKVWRPSGYYRMMEHLTEANAVEWFKKVTRATDPGVVHVYNDGSDIAGNYPVLFGVKDIEPAPTSRAVTLHEVRSEKPVRVAESVTHVEVPKRYVEDTKQLLGSVAVMAIEDGESYSSGYTFSQHIHGVL